jgi:hypothetical protein
MGQRICVGVGFHKSSFTGCDRTMEGREIMLKALKTRPPILIFLSMRKSYNWGITMNFDDLGNVVNFLGDVAEKLNGAVQHTSQAADANTLRDLGLLGGGIITGHEIGRSREIEKQKRQDGSRQSN